LVRTLLHCQNLSGHPSLTDRKVQTIKDLERSWAALTSQDPPSSSPPQTQTQTGHSAATTILLDDSHAKAARQLHNHLCVPEYTRARRNVDLIALQHEQEQQDAHAAAAAAAATAAHEAEAEEPTALDASSPSAQAQDGDDEANHPKRKRKKENNNNNNQRHPALPPTSIQMPHRRLSTRRSSPWSAYCFAARLQSSIAGWMRAGALLSERGKVWCGDPALVHKWALHGREATSSSWMSSTASSQTPNIRDVSPLPHECNATALVAI
jgi:hypothetical protein